MDDIQLYILSVLAGGVGNGSNYNARCRRTWCEIVAERCPKVRMTARRTHNLSIDGGVAISTESMTAAIGLIEIGV